jgi:pimeloyl-ACP methyl ester carboxylesterase
MKTVKRVFAAIGALIVCAYGALVVYAYLPSEELPARALASSGDRFADIDGLEFRYREWGTRRPGTPSLVLLHGFSNSLQTWRLVAPLLQEDWHVIGVDLPGFGLSSKPADHDYHNDAQGRAIVAFAAGIGLDRYVIGGHSMGGAVAVHVAAIDPGVAGMVLLNPGIITTGVPAITGRLFFPLPRVSARMFAGRDFRRRFLERSFIDTSIVTDSVVDDLMLASRSEGYMDGTTSLMKQYAEGAEIAMLPELDLPTILVWGDLDAGKPEGEAARLQSLIAGSELARIADAGHYVHEEAPEASAVAISKFLARIARQS